MKMVVRILFLALFILLLFECLQAVEAKTDHVNSIGIKMCPVPQGKFMMGSDLSELDHWDEWPVREVIIGSDFLISETRSRMSITIINLF